MSSRSSYSQKKKKEALRRLSQGGTRGIKTPSATDPDVAQRHGRGARGIRHQRDAMENMDGNPRRGLLSGRRVVATDSPSSGSNLVIQASLGGQLSGTDTPRRVVASQALSNPQTKGPSLFGKRTDLTLNPLSGSLFARVGGVSTGTFGLPQKSSEESGRPEVGSQFQTSPTRKNLFQCEPSNPFSSRGQFGSASSNVFQTSSKGDLSVGNIFEQAAVSDPFTKLSPDAQPAGVPESLFKSKEAAPGLDSVTRNLFGKPAPKSSGPNPPFFGKPSVKPSDQTSTVSTKALFGKEFPISTPNQSELTRDKPQTQELFENVLEPSGRRDRGDASSKRQLSPGRAEASSKRTLTTFDDPFSSGSSDITDLETFGASTSKRDSRLKKPVIKRSGLFGKAIAEASGRSHVSARESHGSRSHSPEERKQQTRSPEGRKRRSHSPEERKQQSRSPERRKRQSRSPEERKQRSRSPERRLQQSRSPEERKRRSPDRQLEDGRKKKRDENKPARRSSTSSSSSRRFASPEEIKNLVTIIVKGVPPVANSRAFVKEFFSQYGSVTRVYTNPGKNSATIYFADHDSAACAKKKVKVMKRGTNPVSIFWRQGDQRSRSENRLSQDDEKLPSTRRQGDKQTILRQSLAPFNRKVETKVNLEDGSSRSIIPQSTGTVSIAGHPRNTNLSIPAHLLSKQVGLTAQERYDILEDRNKIIRQELKKKSHLATAEAIRGTCPDMCPEKERYMRVVQRRLHPYEVLPGSADKVNHDTAVKEYSRSSADQEEPLPHEMRPAPILTLTMNYLMRHVMNTGRDGHWEEWFDFLWSRTRGIRKDIAQQDLRGLTAIDLMEKCARFHIFCSHRLCEEDRSTIDPKINNENLTKCMQSLKQFYHDLASEGAVCPNEAEFRAYDVLLNLNDRDILRQVQQYRMNVRSSEAVKFALKAFSAVSSNNYVKFFKLVRSTTFLNTCIMHRYFMQVRNMALDVMNKAYTISSNRGSRFPLANIKTTLAFDDQSQASEFCQSHNLAVENDMVQFSRAAFQHPDVTQSAERSHTIIEAKNTMMIGEVVNGGPLPPDVIHKPSSSFDENGNYKGYTVISAETATSETKSDVISEKARLAEGVSKAVDSQTVTAPPAVSTVPTLYSNVEIKEVARNMFLEVIDEMVRDLSNSFLGWIHLIQVGSVEILQDTMEEVVTPTIREIVLGAVEEQKLIQEQQRRHEAQMAELTRRRRLEQQAIEEQRQRRALIERRERMELAAQGVLGETVDEVVDEESRMIANAEMRAVRQQLKKESVERCIAKLHNELIEESLLSECQQVSAEVIQAETALRDQRLVESERAVMMGRMARYLERWHRVYTKRIHLKHTLLTFPAAPPNQTAAEQLRVLWAGRADRTEVKEGQRRRDVTLDSPFGIVTGREHIAKSILRIHYLKNLRQQQAWLPLDLPSMLSSSFHSHHAPGLAGSYHSNRQQQHHYWKLVSSLSCEGSHDQELLHDWLKAKLRRGRISESVRRDQLEDNDQVETLSLYSSRVFHVSSSQPCTLSICTKVMTGSLDSTRQGQARRQLLGTSGILFALDPAGADQNYWLRAKSRLDSILQAKPASPPPPLVIALLDWSATEHAQSMCEEALQLRRMSRMGLVSSYRFMELKGDVEGPENSKELNESLEWLASRCPPPPFLSEDSLKGYLDTGMTEFFSLPLHEDARTRRGACLPEQDCHRVIDLYNATVRHLANVASSGTLTSLSWPPAEFTKTDKQTELPSPDWNAKETIELLRDRILSLILPCLPPIHEDDDWQSVCEVCHQYLLSLPGGHKAKAPLFARVQRILEKCRRTFEDTCYLAFDAPGCEPMAGHVPWTRIVQECSDYVMSTIQSHDLDCDECKLATVYYVRSEFDSFQIPQTWKEAVTTTTEESFIQPPRFASQVAGVVQQKQTEFLEGRREATMTELKENQKLIVTCLEREPSFVVNANDSTEAVKMVLSSAKEESKKFDELLQKWLHGTDQMTLYDRQSALGTETDHSRKTPLSPPFLEQSLQDLRLTMESERRADRLAELRLASLLSL